MPFNKARALQDAEKSVAQGRLSQAIGQYLEIINNDPSDLALLNTAGDLSVRNNDIPEALSLFRKLAEAYVREGFVLRAIAIYRKIIKLDASSIDPRLNLADLYAGQGLSREARDLYAHALAEGQRQNQKEKVIEVMRRIVAGEPANVEHLLRLAECCQAVGRTYEAQQSYLSAAEAALDAGNAEGAARALDRAADINPTAARLVELRRRLSPASEGAPEAAPAAAGIAEPPVEEPVVESLPVLASFEAAPAGEPAPETGAEAVTASAAAVEQAPPPEVPDEIDLSNELEAVAAGPGHPAAPPTPDWTESSAEIDFYLEYGLPDEARKTMERLEESFSAYPQVAELRRRLDARLAPTGSSGLLADLARGLEASWPGVEPTSKPSKSAASEPDFAASLGALLEELGTEAGGPDSTSDLQTHYELGIAFREMGLVDEAIGELQKVVRDARPGDLPPQFLSACSLLGLCFMEKQLPKLAVKWYGRALELPDLQPEAVLALQYDLGVAYEQAGEREAARARFLEVYGQNIDYRDVAEKVRMLAVKS